MEELNNIRQMHSVFNELALSEKPFSLNDVYVELKMRGVIGNSELRSAIEAYFQNMLDQDFILAAGACEAFPYRALFIASEQLLHTGEITPGCIDNGINLSGVAMYATLAELRKQNKKE